MAKDKHDFYDYLSADNIMCNLKGEDGNKILQLLMKLLKSNCPTLDVDLATKEVRAREELFPTVIAPGLAVPHARLVGLKKPQVALACIPNGANFGGEQINVMILLLTPVDEPNLHVQLLSAFASDFSQPDAINKVAQMINPAEVYAYFTGTPISIPDFLKAADVMVQVPVLHETDSLAKAISIFAQSKSEMLPVLDNVGDLRGVVSLSALLKYSLPEHLLWLEDLSYICHFQPFSEMLRSADETMVADLIEDNFVKVKSDVPAIQLAKLFLVKEARELVIVDSDDHLVGMVSMKSFVAKLFWE